MIKIFRKLSIFFVSIFNIKTKLGEPIKNFSYNKKKENALLGTWYEEAFSYKNNHWVESPISGKIKKIYLNETTLLALIVNNLGIEVMMFLEKDKNCPAKFLKEENNSVRKGEKIISMGQFIDQKEEKEKKFEINLSVIVPWQPLKIKKIENAFISYRNPFSRFKIKNVCEY